MRLILCLLLIVLAAQFAPAQTPDANDVKALLARLEHADAKNRKQIVSAILDAGESAHEPLYDGSEATDALRRELRAKIRSARDAKLASQGLVVHEWGSVRMLANHKGATVGTQWTDASDLPKFVYVWENMRQDAPMVIEKPIIYFYPPEGFSQALSVSAIAPQGFFTQYFPKPTNIQPVLYGDTPPQLNNARLDWAGITFHREASDRMPVVDKSHPWWHIARDVDAKPLIVGNEAEKFLFYRGVTKSQPSISIAGDEASGKYELTNQSAWTIEHVIMMRVTGQSRSYHLVRKLDPKQKVMIDLNSAGPQWTAAGDARDHFTEHLQWRGLYPKEAAGLTKIWGKMFFEQPGVRLLYVMPDAEADQMIKLTVTPKPADLARTLIVQIECETQALRDRIKTLIDGLADVDFAKREASQRQLESLDRFAESLLREAIKDHPDEEVRQRARNILDNMRRKN